MVVLKDGHSTTILFSSNSSIALKMKEVTPPGVQGGGEIDITTMDNTTWRTRAPKSLKTLSNASFVAAYDPVVYDAIVAMVGVNQLITVTFPDDSTVAFWGWLDEFTPGRNVEGEQPTAECVIIPSNRNNSDAETPPDYTAAP